MSEKGSWIVTLQEVVVREYRCEGCTKEEARENPWDRLVGESVEIECNETTVLDVEPAPPRSLTVEEAQRLRVCRICRKPMSAPFLLNFGKEFAHEACLESNSK